MPSPKPPTAENSPEPIWVGHLAVWQHRVEKPRARVLLVHGISEHSGRHHHTFDFFQRQNIELVRFDMRGAGRSGGKRQWCEEFHDYVQDVDLVYQWICRTADPLPFFLMGHSLGGAIALHFAADRSHELDGLVLTAPAFRPGKGISPAVVFLGTWANRVFPSFRLPKPLDMEAISRIPEVVRAYAEDPLVCHANTVHQGVEVLKGLNQIPGLLKDILCPTVLLHGSDDRVINPEGSFEIVRGLGGQEKALHILPGGYHEPHNDLERENFYRYLEVWFNRRLKAEADRVELRDEAASPSSRRKRRGPKKAEREA